MEGMRSISRLRDVDKVYVETILVGLLDLPPSYENNTGPDYTFRADRTFVYDMGVDGAAMVASVLIDDLGPDDYYTDEKDFLEMLEENYSYARSDVYHANERIIEHTEELLWQDSRDELLETLGSTTNINSVFFIGPVDHSISYESVISNLTYTKSDALKEIYKKLRLGDETENVGVALVKRTMRLKLDELLNGGGDGASFPFTDGERTLYRRLSKATSRAHKEKSEQRLMRSFLSRLDRAAERHVGVVIARLENAIEEKILEYTLNFYVFTEAYLDTYSLINNGKSDDENIAMIRKEVLHGSVHRKHLIRQNEISEAMIRTLFIYQSAMKDIDAGLPITPFSAIPLEVAMVIAPYTTTEIPGGYEFYILAKAYERFLADQYVDARMTSEHAFFSRPFAWLAEARLKEDIAIMQAEIEMLVAKLLSEGDTEKRESLYLALKSRLDLVVKEYTDRLEIISFGNKKMLAHSTNNHLEEFIAFERKASKGDHDTIKEYRLVAEARIILDVFTPKDMYTRILSFLRRSKNLQTAALEELQAQAKAAQEALNGVPAGEESTSPMHSHKGKRRRIGKARLRHVVLPSRASASRERIQSTRSIVSTRAVPSSRRTPVVRVVKEKHEKSVLLF